MSDPVSTSSTALPAWLARAAGPLSLLKIGGSLVYHPRATSTNDVARALAATGAPDGLLVVADEQTHGRGRMGRAWVAEPESALLLSVLLRRPVRLDAAVHYTMIAALAISDAITETTGLRPALKWPNDVELSGRKVAGILTELEAEGDQVSWAVLGIGVNVAGSFADHAELADSAISLAQAAEREVNRTALLVALVRSLSRRYATLAQGDDPHAEWSSRLVTLGQPVRVEMGAESFEGLAEAVLPDGLLVVRLPDGKARHVAAGDVRVRPRRPRR